MMDGKNNSESKQVNINDEFASIMKNVPDGIVKRQIIDGKCKILFASERVATMLGYTLEELLPLMDEDINFEVHPEDIKLTSSYIASGMKEPGYFECRYRAFHKDGRTLHLEACTNVIIEEDGSKTLYSTIYDVEKEIEIERNLRIKEKAFSVAASHSSNLTCLYDINTHQVSIDPDIAKAFHLQPLIDNVPDAIIEAGIIAPECIECYEALYNDINNKRSSNGIELKRKIGTGDYQWYKVEYVLVQEDDYNHPTAIITYTNIDKDKKNEQMATALLESEQLTRIISKHSQKYLVRYDYDTNTIIPLGDHVNIANRSLEFLKTPENYYTKGIISRESVDEVRNGFASMKAGCDGAKFYFKAKNLKSEWIWMECIMSNVFDDNGKPAYIIASFEDVTEYHENRLAFERYKNIMNSNDINKTFFFDYNLTQDSLEADSGNIRISGLMEEARKGYMHFIWKVTNTLVVDKDKGRFVETFDESRLLKAFAVGSDNGGIELQVVLSQYEEPVYVKASYQLVKEPYNSNVRLLFHCEIIDEKKRAELKYMRRAKMDELTQIFNRATFIEEVNRRIASIDKNKTNAFVLLDVDCFKIINDTFGHVKGDEILCKVAKVISDHLFQRDIVGRFGGDEFGMFICGLSDINDVKQKMEIILEKICEDLGDGIMLSASIGVAILTMECSTFQELYKKSDNALYYVKNNGKNGYKIY